MNQPIRGLRLDAVPEYFGAGLDKDVDAAVRAAIKSLEDQGATVTEVSLPHSKYAIAVYYLVATAEASSNLARYDGMHYGHRASKAEDLIDLVSTTAAKGRPRGQTPNHARRRAAAGYRDAYYVNALKIRRLIKQDFDRRSRSWM